GKHTIKIRLVDKNSNEVLNESTKSITVEKPKSTIYIDEPTKTTYSKDSTITVRGWSMSNITSKEIEIYVDNTKVENVEKIVREDVLKVITGYGSKEQNPTSGYKSEISAQKLKTGSHTIKIRLVDKNSNEVLNEATKNITIEKPKSTIYIDEPTDKINKTELLISGWSMSNNLSKEIEIYVDNTKVENVEKIVREDVLKAVTGYGSKEQNPTPGFKVIYDSSTLSDGTHTVKVNLIDSDTKEIYSTTSKKFTVKKYDGTIYLDTPTGGNFSSEFIVSGWEMSELDNSYIKIYVDGNQIPYTINREAREDVLKTVTEYGGRTTNSMPGFNVTIPITNYNEGMHTITIKLFTRLDEEISKYNKQIFISKSTSYGIDISEYQTVYNWNLVKAYGIDYAIIRSAYRGYGSAGRLVQDSKFFDHVKGASSVGLKLGTYVFSQAVNEQEGRDEANLAIQMVNLAGGKSKFQMPIIFDAEYSSCAGHCGRADALSKQQRTNIVKAFCETVKNAGYTPMIYASPNFFNNNLDMSQLSEYQVWVANYGVSKPYYSGPYQIWQYTSDGSVTGINGRVDMNYIYLRY
ncbi:MAG: glycoside hydrolase family 25 protein, partial [Bacilli bacterium]|nr:glycoside hydrolase family 25 protein [Bacilli bacterium]